MRTGQLFIWSMLALLVLIPITANIYADLFWFMSLGYESVFLKTLGTSIGLGLLTGISFFVFAFINIRTAKRRSVKKEKATHGMDRFFLALSLLFALIVGLGFSDWEIVLKFLNRTGFGVSDPVFGLDIGFYFFSLPFYGFLLSFVFVTLVLTVLLTLGAYLLYSHPVKRMETDEEGFSIPAYSFNLSEIRRRFAPHLSVLLSLLFFAAGIFFMLARYMLLFSETGAVYGAGFTDLNVSLLVVTLLSIVSFMLGVLFMLNLKIRRMRLPLEGVAILGVIAALGFVAAGVTQAFVVSPNEFNLEKIYIERNIQNTLEAYNLNNIEESIFPVYYNLTKADIERNRGTIDNIRLWDWRPLTKTYNQLQLFRTYYSFGDVDIDRYMLDGRYKQVMVSSREMNTDNLQPEAKTWVNEHLVYTHGYGIVMNPVDKVSKEGLPEFYVKDIPPRSDFITLERPEIYYGHATRDYVIVRTTTEEFDYPSGEQNFYTTYQGKGGVSLSGLKKLVYALKFGSVELLVSGSITPESRILFYRRIEDRVSRVAPFLRYDHDPYIVASEGRLYWMIDAYTVSDMYPYSEPVYLAGFGTFNYIRNSVKVVVDAYNGDVKYYVIDQKDPLIRTYRKMFPDLFVDFSEMPEDLQRHVRYPEDLFSIQAALYSLYHMKDPRVFYNKEDVWVIPEEIYRGNRQRMIPYFVIMKLPDQEKEEFILMIPFTPKGKDNLIAWMAAKCDFPNYGEVVVFQFSKQELIYGPLQIEARIDQDTEISQDFTLWSQAGSDVIRGNTLVIPIENSIIYVAVSYTHLTLPTKA